MATTMGLCAVALTTNPSFPGYPNALSAGEVSAGLPAPAAAAALLGKTGASMMLVLLFCTLPAARVWGRSPANFPRNFPHDKWLSQVRLPQRL